MKSSTILSLVALTVVMLVIGTVSGSVLFPVTKTVSITENTTNVFTTTETFVTVVSTILVSNTVISCPENYPNGTTSLDAMISLNENSTGYLCVRYYYFNSSASMSINTSSVFGIAGYRTFNSTYSNGFDASPNFTITASPEELTLGGPQNLSEGSFVLYTIHAKPNSSGTYDYGFQATIYPGFLGCNGFSEIIAGSGSPDYNLGFGSCTAASTDFYPLNSSGFVNGFLTVEVVGITNSTA